MNDPIVDEVRKFRDAHASRFNDDLDAIFREIKEHERKSGRTFVSFPPRKAEPNQGPHATGDVTSAEQSSSSIQDVSAT